MQLVAGSMSLRTTRRLVSTVRGFQWRVWRSRNSSANAVMGRPGWGLCRFWPVRCGWR